MKIVLIIEGFIAFPAILIKGNILETKKLYASFAIQCTISYSCLKKYWPQLCLFSYLAVLLKGPIDKPTSIVLTINYKGDNKNQLNNESNPEAAIEGVLIRKLLLEISQNSLGTSVSGVSFLIKLLSWGMQLYEKKLQHRCFLVKFAKFFLQNTYGWLLLQIQTEQIKGYNIYSLTIYTD